MDPLVNFGYTSVSAAPSPASSGLTIEFTDPSVFPDPDVDGAFNLVVWEAGAGLPLVSTAEIIRCTALSAGVFTIARSQEGTGARTVEVGDQVALPATVKTFTDLRPKVVSVSDTADPSQVAMVSSVFDTRGVNALTLDVEITELGISDWLTVFVLSRRAGLPWMPAAVMVQTSAPPFSLDLAMTFVPAGLTISGQTIPAHRRIPCFGLLDESIIVAQPAGPSVAGASLVIDTITCGPFANVNGDWANMVSVEYADPAAINSPLGVDSTTGWDIRVLLETDGAGDIVTVSGEVDVLLNPSSTEGYVFTLALSDTLGGVQAATGPTNLSGGVAGCTDGVTYTITGTY